MTRFLAVLVAVLCFCSGPSLAASTAPRAHTARTAATAPSDTQLEATIRAKLAKSKIGKDGFRFKVSHGVVTWEGTTSVIQHKGSATRMARTAGAVQVINNIQVSESAKAKAGGNLKKAYVQQ
jgi:hypothetical protein